MPNIIPPEEFIFKYENFDGQHSIDANTLINSLLHLTAVMQEISKTVQPEQESQIKIRATAPGSFHVLFEITKTAQGLWHEYGNIIKDGGYVLTAINGFLALKRHCKGKQPKEVIITQNNTTVINIDNITFSIDSALYKLYTENPVIDKALSQHFETLEEDESISSFDLLQKDETPVLKIPREEFSGLAIETEPSSKESQEVTIPNASVTVIKILFEENKKWDFIYNGNKISARISDAFFNDKIDKAEIRFAKGDRLVVDLLILQAWDTEYRAWINKSYEIKTIREFYRAPTQEKFDFGRTE